VAFVLYWVLFFCAPLIASFYKMPILIPIVRVLALVLIPGAFNSIQVAYVTKRMQFRKLFVSNLAAVLISGVLGIVLAKRGFGAWAIVAQQLGTQVIVCVMLMVLSEWKPRAIFSMQSVRALIPFGSRVLASNLLVTVFLNVRTLIIGKVYSTEDLAFFNRGKTFPSTVMDAVNGTIQSVMLPAYSSVQDQSEALLAMLRRSVRTGCFIIFPCLFGLAAVANPFIDLVLTEKWLPAVPFLQIFAISYLTHPIQMATNQALKAIGRSDLSLRIELYRKISEALLLIAAITLGPKMIAWSTVVASLIACVVSAPIVKKYLNYGYGSQILDILPSLLMSGAMFLGIWLILRLPGLNNVTALLLGILTGVVVYVLLAVLTRSRDLRYLISLLRRRNKKEEA
jgi:O-antigen/teichoic acid export membrane protein